MPNIHHRHYYLLPANDGGVPQGANKQTIVANEFRCFLISLLSLLISLFLDLSFFISLLHRFVPSHAIRAQSTAVDMLLSVIFMEFSKSSRSSRSELGYPSFSRSLYSGTVPYLTVASHLACHLQRFIGDNTAVVPPELGQERERKGIISAWLAMAC